jgi:hypothetical protein
VFEDKICSLLQCLKTDGLHILLCFLKTVHFPGDSPPFTLCSVFAASRLKDVQAAAEAAAIAMQREVAAEVTPPPRTDPKIAVMNLLQVGHRAACDVPVSGCSTAQFPCGLGARRNVLAATHALWRLHHC